MKHAKIERFIGIVASIAEVIWLYNGRYSTRFMKSSELPTWAKISKPLTALPIVITS